MDWNTHTCRLHRQQATRILADADIRIKPCSHWNDATHTQLCSAVVSKCEALEVERRGVVAN